MLLEKGAESNAQVHYATALHLAVAKGDSKLVDLILAHGAIPLIEDDNYSSPAAGWAEWGGNKELHRAIQGNATETVRCLLENSLTLTKPQIFSPADHAH